MQIPWLEELEQNSSISKEAKQAIYSDCSDLIELMVKKAEDSPSFEELLKADKDSFIAYNNMLASEAQLEDTKELTRIKDKDRQNLMLSKDIAELGADTQKDLALQKEWETKSKALSFVNKGLNAMMGPMPQAIEKFTRPVRIGYAAHKTEKFLEGTIPEKDLPKAKARFEQILDYAPALSQNPLEAQKIVAKTLHSGLTNDDKDYLRSLQAREGYSIWDTGKTQQALLAGREHKLKSSLRKALQKSAQVRADHLATVAELIYEATEGHEKVAGGPSMVQAGAKPGLSQVAWNALKTLGLVSMVPLVAGGLTGIGKTLVNLKQKKELEKKINASFEQALSGKDDYSRGLRENKDKARSAFETLVHFAPDVATQPSAAKSFMHKMVVIGGPEVGLTTSDIKDLADIQRNVTQSKGEHPFTSGFSSASRMMGLSNLTSDTMKGTSQPLIDQSQEFARAHLAEGGPGFISA